MSTNASLPAGLAPNVAWPDAAAGAATAAQRHDSRSGTHWFQGGGSGRVLSARTQPSERIDVDGWTQQVTSHLLEPVDT